MAISVKSIQAWQSFDATGLPTITGSLTLDDGYIVTASVPNKAHPGTYSAHYLFDETDVFEGKGVNKAISYVTELLGKKLIGVDPLRAVEVDQWLLKADPSELKEVLGANTTYLLSQLMYQAGAHAAGKPLYIFLNDMVSKYFGLVPLVKMPSPIFPMITGGSHGSSTINFQEFSIIPSTSKKYPESLNIAYIIFHELERVFMYRNIFAGIGNEGAYVPALATNGDAFEIIKEALLKRGYKVGVDVYFGIDFAADFFYKGKYYISDSPTPLTTEQMLERILKLDEEYRALVIEDPFSTKDEHGWKSLTSQIGGRSFIVSDDLTQTNNKHIQNVLDNKLCNTICIKPPQRGTVWEAMQALSTARDKNAKVVVTQNASETNDTFLADFAVAMQADFVKFGSLSRGERIAKHNRMLEIAPYFTND